MSSWLAGFVIGVTLALYVAWFRADYRYKKLARICRRLVRHARPGTAYDESVIANDFLRELRFLVGDRVSEGSDGE